LWLSGLCSILNGVSHSRCFAIRKLDAWVQLLENLAVEAKSIVHRLMEIALLEADPNALLLRCKRKFIHLAAQHAFYRPPDLFAHVEYP
jgi:hypothetical protein